MLKLKKNFIQLLLIRYRGRLFQWKRINRKQSARWEHPSRLKASAFFSLRKKLVVKEHNNLYLGLVTPFKGRVI